MINTNKYQKDQKEAMNSHLVKWKLKMPQIKFRGESDSKINSDKSKQNCLKRKFESLP